MKVLVIDDDAHIRQLVQVNLELDDMIVQAAPNGKEGIKIAKKFIPDLVLMDWMMPEMDGLATTKFFRSDEALKRIPIFMLTAKSQITDIDKAFEAGADNYITKPFDPIYLAATLKSKLKSIHRK